LRVAQLSRFTTAKEAKLIREGLADGSVHIVVGTHALLSDSVKFDNLGLLIIDEEQHFGVKQKEKLKAIKADVHILTLSATPIPRTLQLALSGVRELSLITTPPVDRLAVRTFVMPVDTVVLREAIHRELHRGGQVFYVAPRIADLADLKQMIMEIAPTARLAVAHGQMSTGDLDDVMNHFYDGNADILLSTAIVESGIDVPTANTLIVHRADKFGLSQLYQLRGRVGRGKIRAYAYLTLPNQHHLSAQALKRLEVMQALDTLGAGFSLASHDMDIRGFGNLVGEEQSGHVKEVGVELYQQMLEEAVNAAKQQQSKDKAVAVEEQWSPQINLGMSILIPETYVEDLALRLSLYRRLSTLQDDNEIDSFAAEMVDRFGSLPQEVVHLLDVLRLKRTCIKLGIAKLDTGPKGAVITFRNNQFAAPDALIGFLARNMQRMKLRPDQTIFCALVPTEDNDLRIRQVSGLLGELAALLG
jgi:transcription-repair coupling factor (superfamily II helicase)